MGTLLALPEKGERSSELGAEGISVVAEDAHTEMRRGLAHGLFSCRISDDAWIYL